MRMRHLKYEQGRRAALEQLGLKQRPQDNAPVSSFLEGISDEAPRASSPDVKNVDRKRTWGKAFQIPTSQAEL